MHINNSKKFDSRFETIEHYKIYPEMKPFIGENYEKNRVLIITESHYWPQKLTKEKFEEKIKDWYTINNLTDETRGNVHTRGVINEVNKGKGHRIFSNLQKALNEASMNLNDIAWYNFFQCPAMHKDGLKPVKKDIEKALKVFEENCKILEPKLIIFASKLSFDSIHKENGMAVKRWDAALNAHFFKEFSYPIQYTVHPNSRQWNSKKCNNLENSKQKINGHQKFVLKLKNVIN